MLSNFVESTNDRNPYFVGTVVDNFDPTFNYRVKIRLPKIHDNIDDKDLPWAARVDRAYRGIESDTPDIKGAPLTEENGTKAPRFDHRVPAKGTKLLIQAIRNDMNSLVYIGALYKKTEYTPTNQEEYLKTYGIYADEKQFIGIDTRKQNNELIVHFIGDVDVDLVKNINVNAEENIVVTNKQNVTIKSTGSGKISVINANGQVYVESKTLVAKVSGSSEITCPTTTIKGNVKVQGNIDVTGNIGVTGNVDASGNMGVTGNLNCSSTITGSTDCIGGGVSLKSHTHKYNPGSSPQTNTTPPM